MPKDILVKLEITNQKVAKELKKVVHSLDGFRLQGSDYLGACDLLILEVGDDPGKDFQLLYSFTTSGLAREVYLTSLHFDSRILIEAKRAGIRRFLSQPISKEELRNALLAFKEKERPDLSSAQEQKGRMLYLIGCKGGVGTTTVAVNLASSLVELDKSRSVVLTDLALPFGDMPIFLNVDSAPNWDEVARNISQINPTLLNSILFRHPSGLFVLPAPSGPNSLYRMSPETIERILSIMQEANDFIVIDGGKYPGAISHKILEISDWILMVIGLSYPCIANGKRLLSIMYKLNYLHKKIKIVLNRYQGDSPISLAEAERKIIKDIFWKIPNDFQTTMDAIEQGKVLSEVGEGKEICNSFRGLASFFLGIGQQGKRENTLGKVNQESRDQGTQLRLRPFYNPGI
jgi:pilus assembly protein CpaE